MPGGGWLPAGRGRPAAALLPAADGAVPAGQPTRTRRPPRPRSSAARWRSRPRCPAWCTRARPARCCSDLAGPDQARAAFGTLAGRFAGRLLRRGGPAHDHRRHRGHHRRGAGTGVRPAGGVRPGRGGDRGARRPRGPARAADHDRRRRPDPLDPGRAAAARPPWPAAGRASPRCATPCSGCPGSPTTCPRSAELDLNPVIACADGVTAVDARIRVSAHSGGRPVPPPAAPGQTGPAWIQPGIPAKELIPR